MDAYGLSTTDQFRFVRLTVDPREDDPSAASVGAFLLGPAPLCSAPRRRGAVRVQP